MREYFIPGCHYVNFTTIDIKPHYASSKIKWFKNVKKCKRNRTLPIQAFSLQHVNMTAIKDLIAHLYLINILHTHHTSVQIYNIIFTTTNNSFGILIMPGNPYLPCLNNHLLFLKHSLNNNPC